MTTIVVFGVSLSLVAIVTAFKYFELRFERRNPLLRSLSKFDPQVGRGLLFCQNWLLKIIDDIKHFLSVGLRVVIEKFLEKTKARVLKELHARQEVMMGRKEISSRGAASFYLRKINEAKGNQKGEIN